MGCAGRASYTHATHNTISCSGVPTIQAVVLLIGAFAQDGRGAVVEDGRGFDGRQAAGGNGGPSRRI